MGGVGAKVLVVGEMDWKSSLGLLGLMMQGSDMVIRRAPSVSRCEFFLFTNATEVLDTSGEIGIQSRISAMEPLLSECTASRFASN